MKIQKKVFTNKNHFRLAEEIFRLIIDFANNYLEREKRKASKNFTRYCSYPYHLFTAYKLKKHGFNLHSLCLDSAHEYDFINALLKIDNDLFIKSKLRRKLKEVILDLLIERKSSLIVAYARIPHIICKLKGGLGNQLFQIATAVGTGLDFTLITDDPSFHAGQGSHPRKYYDNLYAKIPKKTKIEFQSIRPLPCNTQADNQCNWMRYNEAEFAYHNLSNIVARCIKDNIGIQLNGYFQSERYFANMSAAIKELFTPLGGLISTVRSTTDLFIRFPELDPEIPSDCLKRCFLGVRRGDYCKSSEMINYYNPCSLDYYRRAMDNMKADIYYVMSDDISWCRENFQGQRFRFLDEHDDLISFYFARLFSNYICANSSFHWWASYLSLDPAPKVIVPAEHFGTTGPQDYQDYFRSDMIRISNHLSPPIDITVCVPLSGVSG
jgi:hypothetical protein